MPDFIIKLWIRVQARGKKIRLSVIADNLKQLEERKPQPGSREWIELNSRCKDKRAERELVESELEDLQKDLRIANYHRDSQAAARCARRLNRRANARHQRWLRRGMHS